MVYVARFVMFTTGRLLLWPLSVWSYLVVVATSLSAILSVFAETVGDHGRLVKPWSPLLVKPVTNMVSVHCEVVLEAYNL